jgi:non-ribosomal peptide synthetase component F
LQVNNSPDAIAVVFDDRRLTYRDLNTRANQLAHYLHKQGVGPEVPVGICMDRSLEMVVGLLGILKAGGVYVPLDTEYPKERLAFILRETGTSLLLTQQRVVSRLPELKPQCLCIDTDWELIDRESEETPRNEASPDNLAYIIYTSGSTGTPKGVAVTHRAVIRQFFLRCDNVRDMGSVAARRPPGCSFARGRACS